MNIVTIKLYLDDTICSDYHDLMFDKYQQKIDELHEYGKRTNKQILFFVCEGNTVGDNFAEITTNADLTTEDKNHFINVLKVFCTDATITDNTMQSIPVPLTVIFNNTIVQDVVKIN